MSEPLANKLSQEQEQLSQEEQLLLHCVDSRIPDPPDRQLMLAKVFDASEHQLKETQMLPSQLTQLFAGRTPALRVTFAAAIVLAVLALSLVLPRGGSLSPLAPAWAANDGYLLAFDFGEGSTQEQVQPVLDQLIATVRAFKEQHNLPLDNISGAGSGGRVMVRKTSESHERSSSTDGQAPTVVKKEESRVMVVIQLPAGALLEEFEAELAKIPGLPAPTRTNATWFAEVGELDPSKQGIHLGLSFREGGELRPHMFYFPDTATEAEIEKTINEWLAINKPDHDFTVEVKLTQDGENRNLEVRLSGKLAEGTVDFKGPPVGEDAAE
jgi:hypothetical protein